MTLGYEAVPLFFILSGFILSHNYFEEFSFGTGYFRFLFLRFARLWPVHCVTLVLLALNPNLLAIGVDSLKSLIEELLMVRLWFHDARAWNVPSWSISAEWFAYIGVFPLTSLLYRRIRWLPGLVIMVMAFLVLQVSPINLILFPPTNKTGTIFFLFLAGCGLYQIRRQTKTAPAGFIVNTGLALLLAFIMFNRNLSEFVLYSAFALVIYGLSFERGWLARMLSTKWIVYGGLASYSLYMTHYLIVQTYIYYSTPYWKTIPNLPMPARISILLAMGIVFLGTAVLFYRTIEEPANKGLRRLVFSRRQVAVISVPIGTEDAVKI
jgi:peptidoglycan/LPS O-acetylase OafA/YrhL